MLAICRPPSRSTPRIVHRSVHHPSFAEQLRALVASAAVLPPMPDFSRPLTDRAWDAVIRTLVDEAVRGSLGRPVFPVEDPAPLASLVAAVERGRLPGELPLVERFFALAAVACHPDCPGHVLGLAAHFAGLVRAGSGPGERERATWDRCMEEIAKRDARGIFAGAMRRLLPREGAPRPEGRPERDPPLADRLRDLARGLAERPFSPEIPSGQIRVDERDVRLAIEWCDGHAAPLLRAWRDCGRDRVRFAMHLAPRCDAPAPRDLNRTLSARIAEKAVKWFYEHRVMPGVPVADVSLLQEAGLHPDRPGRRGPRADGDGDAPWVRQDLAVLPAGGAPVHLDVKNARELPPRRAALGPAGPVRWYVEHCIAGFKENRDGTGVRIAGVFSPERRNGEMLRWVPGDPIVFLGETDAATLPALKKRFEAGGHLVVDFTQRIRVQRTGRFQRFVPPWMYDYPAPLYVATDALLRDARTELLRAARMRTPLPPVPGLEPLIVAAGLWRALEPCVAAEMPAVWRRFGRELARAVRRGRSLPAIYLAVLRHFLATLRSGTVAGFDPAGYRTFLFGLSPRDLPLGLVDPLRSVDSLIDSLVQLTRAPASVLAGLDQFKFGRTGALQARDRHTGKWKTLLFPYCGGGCGATQLVLGKDDAETCPACGRIRCSECDYCLKDCAERKKRADKAGAAGANAGRRRQPR